MFCDQKISPKIERIRNHFVADYVNKCASLFPVKSKQKTIMEIYVPPLSKFQKETFLNDIAMFVYTSGISFNVISNHYFNKAIRALRSDVPIPDRKIIAGELLDYQYKYFQDEVQNHIAGCKCK